MDKDMTKDKELFGLANTIKFNSMQSLRLIQDFDLTKILDEDEIELLKSNNIKMSQVAEKLISRLIP